VGGIHECEYSEALVFMNMNSQNLEYSCELNMNTALIAPYTARVESCVFGLKISSPAARQKKSRAARAIESARISRKVFHLMGA